MKSESFQKMMLRHIIIFGIILLALAESLKAANTNKKTPDSPFMPPSTNLQRQFFSTKERPELNPILSALINEDVKKSIDAKKRHAEYDSSPLSKPVRATTTSTPVHTTVKYIPNARDDSVVVDSMVDSTLEKKQTSRIEIKKGPNGVDYEYEYVYYYYDDDDKDANKKTGTVTDDKSIESQNGGKNRYDKISTTPKPNFDQNELPTSRGKGRKSIPVVEETSEERLPVNTRFPPRSGITPTVQVLSNVDETTKKISIKRPSLELVDSQSFNRGEKGQSKGSRVLENEFVKANDLKTNENPTIIPSVTELTSQSATAATDTDETTTQIMDKVALDLYAHLVNENSNIDLTTSVTLDESSTASDSLTSTTAEFTTIEPTTTTATSTTEATTATTTTTTTTTTTPAPLLLNGRRPSSLGAGRRNPSKSRSKLNESKASSEEPSKESPVLSSEIASTQTKPKNRFSRPTFSARSRPTTAPVAPTEDESLVKQSTKPIAAAPAPRGRTRNRFNPRSTTPASVGSEEKNPDENAIDTSAQITSTQRPLRTRPTFNLRGRSRATPPSTAAPLSEVNTDVTEAKLDSDEKPSTAASLKASSRFNLRRPNQLLSPRGRVSPLAAKTSAPADLSEISSSTELTGATSKSSVDVSKESAIDAESEQIAAEPSTTPQTGLNRLRSRPRIQIQPKAPTANKQPTPVSYINANRKVNPLISRRKIGSSTTTEESPITENIDASEELSQSGLKETSSLENEGNAKEEEEAPPAVVEASSEAPRGLGILANRRRLASRRPGTI